MKTSLKSDTFEEDILAFVKEVKGGLLAVTRQSISDAVEDMQTPKKKGGALPVDNGFLRQSALASLSGWPSGPSENPQKLKFESPDKYTTTASVQLALANMQVGDTFYFGWTAAYAVKQEIRNGFVEKSLQNWQQTVVRNAENFRKRVSE